MLSMTSVLGALVSHHLHHTQPWGERGDDVSVTGVRLPSAGNFLQTMGVRRQELYQQGASGFQGSGPLCPGQGQVHRDSEPQGGGHLRGSPVHVVRAGAVPPGLPHTVVLPPVPAPEPAGSQRKPRRRQKKKSAAEKAACQQGVSALPSAEALRGKIAPSQLMSPWRLPMGMPRRR